MIGHNLAPEDLSDTTHSHVTSSFISSCSVSSRSSHRPGARPPQCHCSPLPLPWTFRGRSTWLHPLFVYSLCSNVTSLPQSHLLPYFSFLHCRHGIELLISFLICLPPLELITMGGFVLFKNVYPAPGRVPGTKQALNKYYSWMKKCKSQCRTPLNSC